METTSTESTGINDDTIGIIVFVFFCIYGVILVIGTPSCTVVILALLRGRSTLWQWPFYHIVYHLIFSDGIFLVSIIVYTFPAMISGGDANEVAGKIVAVIQVITQKAILYLTLLMAFNRLAVFCLPTLNRAFTEKNMKWSLLATWITILFMSTSALLLSPTRKFNRETLKYEDEGEAVIDDHVLYQITENIDYCIPFTIMIFYIFIYFAIRRQRKLTSPLPQTRSKNNEDSKLLVQAFIVTIMLEICNLMKLSGETKIDDPSGWFLYITAMLSLSTSVANHSIHSIIFLIYNTTIRNHLPSLPCNSIFPRRLRTKKCRITRVSSANIESSD